MCKGSYNFLSLLAGLFRLYILLPPCQNETKIPTRPWGSDPTENSRTIGKNVRKLFEYSRGE